SLPSRSSSTTSRPACTWVILLAPFGSLRRTTLRIRSSLRRGRGRPSRAEEVASKVDYPEDLRYTKEHEWLRVEGDGLVRVGITDYAQDALGDVVYVDVPEQGTQVQASQPLGEVESTKSVSDVYSPVSGTVVERNARLDDHPELVNESPYGDG